MPGGTRQAGASPKGGPEKTGKVREQQGRLETLRTLKHRVKTLKKGNSGATLEPEVRNVSQRHLHTETQHCLFGRATKCHSPYLELMLFQQSFKGKC